MEEVIYSANGKPLTQVVEDIQSNIESTIRTIEVQSERLSIPVVFVLLMDHYAYKDFSPEIPPIHELVHKTATHWIDLNPTWSKLLQEQERYQISGEYHWNVAGNHLLANDYASQLQSRVLLLIQ